MVVFTLRISMTIIRFTEKISASQARKFTKCGQLISSMVLASEEQRKQPRILWLETPFFVV